MRAVVNLLFSLFYSCAFLCGCAGAGGSSTSTGTPQTATPAITATAAQGGAMLVSLATTSPSATIYYTLDGSTPTASSSTYEAPFLVASNLTVKAIATAPGSSASSIASQSFAPNIPSGTLVWSDEFSNPRGANAEPNPSVWVFDAGPGSNFGNQEMEIYCAWASSASRATRPFQMLISIPAASCTSWHGNHRRESIPPAE